MRRAIAAMALVGCAAPFAEVAPTRPADGVALVYCGSAATSPESVMKAMEPPTGPTSRSSLPADAELRVCLRLDNHGHDVARLDRSAFELRTPHETDAPSPDRDDELVIAHPGETRELHVSFRYGPLVHGEDVQLVVARALTVGGHQAALPPIVLRKQ